METSHGMENESEPEDGEILEEVEELLSVGGSDDDTRRNYSRPRRERRFERNRDSRQRQQYPPQRYQFRTKRSREVNQAVEYARYLKAFTSRNQSFSDRQQISRSRGRQKRPRSRSRGSVQDRLSRSPPSPTLDANRRHNPGLLKYSSHQSRNEMPSNSHHDQNHVVLINSNDDKISSGVNGDVILNEIEDIEDVSADEINDPTPSSVSSIEVVDCNTVAVSAKTPEIITLDATDTSEADDDVIEEIGVIDEMGNSTLSSPHLYNTKEDSDETDFEASYNHEEKKGSVLVVINCDPNEKLKDEMTDAADELKENENHVEAETLEEESHLSDEEMDVLELRNKLLAELINRTASTAETRTASTVYLESAHHPEIEEGQGQVDAVNENVQSENKESHGDNNTEEEEALRQVILSLMTKKAKQAHADLTSESPAKEVEKVADNNPSTSTVPEADKSESRLSLSKRRSTEDDTRSNKYRRNSNTNSSSSYRSRPRSPPHSRHAPYRRNSAGLNKPSSRDSDRRSRDYHERSRKSPSPIRRQESRNKSRGNLSPLHSGSSRDRELTTMSKLTLNTSRSSSKDSNSNSSISSLKDLHDDDLRKHLLKSSSLHKKVSTALSDVDYRDTHLRTLGDFHAQRQFLNDIDERDVFIQRTVVNLSTGSEEPLTVISPSPSRICTETLTVGVIPPHASTEFLQSSSFQPFDQPESDFGFQAQNNSLLFSPHHIPTNLLGEPEQLYQHGFPLPPLTQHAETSVTMLPLVGLPPDPFHPSTMGSSTGLETVWRTVREEGNVTNNIINVKTRRRNPRARRKNVGKLSQPTLGPSAPAPTNNKSITPLPENTKQNIITTTATSTSAGVASSTILSSANIALAAKPPPIVLKPSELSKVMHKTKLLSPIPSPTVSLNPQKLATNTSSLQRSPVVIPARKPKPISRLIIPVREDDSTSDEMEQDSINVGGTKESNEGGGTLDNNFHKSLDEFLKRTRDAAERMKEKLVNEVTTGEELTGNKTNISSLKPVTENTVESAIANVLEASEVGSPAIQNLQETKTPEVDLKKTSLPKKVVSEDNAATVLTKGLRAKKKSASPQLPPKNVIVVPVSSQAVVEAVKAASPATVVSFANASTLKTSGKSLVVPVSKPIIVKAIAPAVVAPNKATGTSVKTNKGSTAPTDNKTMKTSRDLLEKVTLGQSGLSVTATKQIIDSLTSKIMESKNQLALSFKEKELLNSRQSCFNGLKEIHKGLQHHSRLHTMDSRLQSEIDVTLKRLEDLKTKQKEVRQKASLLNKSIREKSKVVLPVKAKCIILEREAKTLGNKIIGVGHYKVTDLFTKDIEGVVKEISDLHSRQPTNLKVERGVVFHQVISDIDPTSTLGNVPGGVINSPLPLSSSTPAAVIKPPPQTRNLRKAIHNGPVIASTKESDQTSENAPGKTSTGKVLFLTRHASIADESSVVDIPRGKFAPGDVIQEVKPRFIRVTLADISSIIVLPGVSISKVDPHIPLCNESLWNDVCLKPECPLQHL